MEMFTDWFERYKRMPGHLKIGVNTLMPDDLTRLFAIVSIKRIELDPDHLPAVLLAHETPGFSVSVTSGDIVTIRDMDAGEVIDEVIVSPYYGYHDTFEGFVVRQNNRTVHSIINRIESDI